MNHIWNKDIFCLSSAESSESIINYWSLFSLILSCLRLKSQLRIHLRQYDFLKDVLFFLLFIDAFVVVGGGVRWWNFILWERAIFVLLEEERRDKILDGKR